MDKAEFIRLAPKYYALAILLQLVKGKPVTYQSIAEEYTVKSDDEDEFLLQNGNLWAIATDWLMEKELVVAFSDPFGPPVYTQTDTFDSRFNDLFNSEMPFQNAQASGDSRRWAFQALRRVYEEEIRLSIRSSDFDDPESEWKPIPLEPSNLALQNAVISLDKTIVEIEQSNGYASEHPEERNFVLDNLRLLSQKLKSAGTVSVLYVRTHGLNVLKRVQDRFVDTAIGEGAKETTKAILRWLQEIVHHFIP
jgi:hypothetical protein